MKRQTITLAALVALVAILAFVAYATAPTTLTGLPATPLFDAPITSYDAGQYNAINSAITTQNANNLLFATTPVNSAQLDPTTVQYATVNIALTPLLALHTTPKTLVAAQGSGTLIEPLSVILEWVYGSAACTIGSATNFAVQYTNASGATLTGTVAATGLFDQTATTVAQLLPSALAATAQTSAANQAIVLSLAGGNMTVGTGGSAVVKVAYRVHSGL